MSLLVLLKGGSPGTVNAQTATATGTAYDASVDRVYPTTATGTGTAYAPTAATKTSAATTATATGSIPSGTWADVRDGFTLNLTGALEDHVYLWVRDLSGTQVYLVVDPDAFEVEWRLQSFEGLRWRLPADDDAVAYLEVEREVTYGDQDYVITLVQPVRDGAQMWVEYEAEAVWTNLGKRRWVGTFALANQTPDAGLADILSPTSWTVVANSDVTTYSMDAQDESVLELVRRWAKVCNYEVEFDTQAETVTFVAQQGSTNAVGFAYGRNVVGIAKREEPPRATRLYAFGRNSIDLVGTVAASTYIEDYSYFTGKGLALATAQAYYRKDEVWFADEFVDDGALYAAAVDRLAVLAQPRVSYECKVADLSRFTGVDEASFGIGDTVRVTDTDLGVDITTRVVRIIRRPLDPARNEVELSQLWGEDLEPGGTRPSPANSAEWYQFDDDTDVDATITTTEQRLCILPELKWSTQGQAHGGWFCYATATGSGTVRFRMLDLSNSLAQVGRAWSYDFNAATFDTLTFGVPYKLNALSGTKRLGLYAQITSGTGSLAVATDDAEFFIVTKGLIGTDDPVVSTSQTFSYTGAAQTFTVPAGVSRLVVSMYGAAGGAGQGGSGGAGGLGSFTKVAMPVTGGEILQVNVGGVPASTPGGSGWNGGAAGGNSVVFGEYAGGGGGMSDVRRGSYAVDDIIACAGGGGGGGYLSGAGGTGGYPTGSSGAGSAPGGGGTQSAGGTAGTFASAGTHGAGGAGVGSSGHYGGGGGGGWYGGGGGGADSGAGGGSSYFDEVAGVTLLDTSDGTHSGNGQIVIEW